MATMNGEILYHTFGILFDESGTPIGITARQNGKETIELGPVEITTIATATSFRVTHVDVMKVGVAGKTCYKPCPGGWCGKPN
jgi:hypothetical protein